MPLLYLFYLVSTIGPDVPRIAADTKAVTQGRKIMARKTPFPLSFLLLRIDARMRANNNIMGTWKIR
jgi:hypothetical protein